MVDVYQIITERIMDLLGKGTVPWQRPWGGPENFPKNLVSGKSYRGINSFLLASAGYESPYWLTFKQARERGGNVKKGETGLPAVYWNWFDREDPKTKEIEKRPFLRYYTVFNAAGQCENVPVPALERPVRSFSPLEACEALVRGMPNPPALEHGGVRACYSPTLDKVQIPSPEKFHDSESYYSTLFHELTHSTGHSSRLARPGITEPIIFGSREYSREELVAEMGAAFLCGHTGIENKVIDNSASYVASWLNRLQNDSRLVVHAAAQAQKASDYILNKKPEEDASPAEEIASQTADSLVSYDSVTRAPSPARRLYG